MVALATLEALLDDLEEGVLVLDEERRTALLALAAQLRAAGAWVVLDNNFRAALWDPATAARWMDRATEVCTHALFSFDDEVAMHGTSAPAQALARIEAFGVREAVVKLGAAGCLVSGAVHVPAREIDAIDTTAAGDSFNAAYLSRRLHGTSPVEAAQHGCALAAAVVAHPGAISPTQAMP